MFITRVYVIAETVASFFCLEIVDNLQTINLSLKIGYESVLFLTSVIIMIRTYKKGKKK